MLLILVVSLYVSLSQAWESWWSIENSQLPFEELFQQNLVANEKVGAITEKKKQLITFLKYDKNNHKKLEQHNSLTDFTAKQKQNQTIIPYLTHTIYVTKQSERSVMNHPEIWANVELLGEDITEGIKWKHIFWTNDRLSVVINGTACDGRCEVRLFNELPGYQDVEQLINQLIDSNLFILDVLKPMILYQFGGTYLSREILLERSFHSMHKVMDSYSGFEGMMWPGLSTGFIGARPKHQAMQDWRDFLLEYYGLTQKSIYGARDLMPMPTFREDIIATSGSRSMTFAIWNNLNKWGNNDAIFNYTMIPHDTCHESYTQRAHFCPKFEGFAKTATIKIGGVEHTFDRFGLYQYERDTGYRTRSGRWHGPLDLMWKLPDGNQETQLWIMDITKNEDILSPNYVTKETIRDFRVKYQSRSFVAEFFCDHWFSKYFETYSGRYIDPLIAKRNDYDLYEDINTPIPLDEL